MHTAREWLPIIWSMRDTARIAGRRRKAIRQATVNFTLTAITRGSNLFPTSSVGMCGWGWSRRWSLLFHLLKGTTRSLIILECIESGDYARRHARLYIDSCHVHVRSCSRIFFLLPFCWFSCPEIEYCFMSGGFLWVFCLFVFSVSALYFVVAYKLLLILFSKVISSQIWNRTKPRALLQNQHTRDVPLVAFMYLVFTHMPDESYRRWLRSLLLYLCYLFWALINSLVW